MNRLLPIITVFFLGISALSANLYAQNADRVSISVNATVEGSINLTTIRSINLGEVQPGQEQINISPIRNPNAGKMVASGIPNARIRVSFIREWQLLGSQNKETITYIYQVAGNTVEDQSTAELLETDNRNLQFNDQGRYYFWIGGTVDISNANPDNYEGEFTIEVEYL